MREKWREVEGHIPPPITSPVFMSTVGTQIKKEEVDHVHHSACLLKKAWIFAIKLVRS
jgi:hypothetical protein